MWTHSCCFEIFLVFDPWFTCGNNYCPHQQCPHGSQARIAFLPCPLHRWLMRKSKLSWIGVAKMYNLNFSNYTYRSLLFPSDIYFSHSASLYDEGKKHDQHRSMYFSPGPGAPCPACLWCFPSQQTGFNRMSCFSRAWWQADHFNHVSLCRETSKTCKGRGHLGEDWKTMA